MLLTNNRENKRQRVALLASIADQAGSEYFRCLIRDASLHGCCVVGHHMPHLPDHVSMRVPYLKEEVHGRIAWRAEKMAGVEFIWNSSELARRLDIRTNLNISAEIQDLLHTHICNVLIRDAGRNHCRIHVSNPELLPPRGYIKIPGITVPIIFQLTARKDNLADIEFLWQQELVGLEL